jgi:hypothetical protein
MRLDRGSRIYHCGISFKHDKQTVPPALKEFLTRELYKAIELWKANAKGALPPDLEHMPIFNAGEELGTKRRNRATSFVWYRLTPDDGWQMAVTLDPNQPVDGFAVSADDDQTQMTLLKDAYVKSDEAGRQLIRLLAHLSIQAALE